MWFIVALGTGLFGCGARAQGVPGRPAGRPLLLVGRLTEQAVRRCRVGGREEWVRPHYEVGFSWAIGARQRLRGLLGRIVAVEGVPAARPAPPVQGAKFCPVWQQRSDQVPGWRGMRYRRPGTGRVEAIRVRRIRPFTGLGVRQKGRQILVRFRNTFGVPLRDLTVTLHYEGCGRKPLPAMRSRHVAVLAPGAEETLRFPAILPKGVAGRPVRAARAWSVQVAAAPGPVVFDLDLPLSDVGIRVACPNP